MASTQESARSGLTEVGNSVEWLFGNSIRTAVPEVLFPADGWCLIIGGGDGVG